MHKLTGQSFKNQTTQRGMSMPSGLQDAWHIECLLEKEEVISEVTYPNYFQFFAFYVSAEGAQLKSPKAQFYF